jgi:GAF domain-containing protein
MREGISRLPRETNAFWLKAYASIGFHARIDRVASREAQPADSPHSWSRLKIAKQKATDMQPDSKGKFKAQKTRGSNPFQTWLYWAIVLGLTLLVIACFKPIFERVGPVSSALITIPVALAGLFFGIPAGVIASLVGVGLSAALLATFSGVLWTTWIINYWPGNLMLIGAGYLSGRLQKEWSSRTRLVNELRARERTLALINITTRDILNPQILGDRYYTLITHLANLYVADYAHFIRWDAAAKKAVLTATTLPVGQPFWDIVLDPKESKIVTTVLNNGRPLVIEDIPNSKYILNPAPLGKAVPKAMPVTLSALCLPLQGKGYIIGAAVLAFNRRRYFTAEDLSYAELAGNQIALALYKIQQDVTIQMQLKEARALATIERALSETEQVGLETVLQLIVDSSRELIPGAKQAILHLLDSELQILVPRAVAGIEKGATSRLSMRVGDGVAGQVFASGEVISITDSQSDPRLLKQADPVNFRSLLVAQIRSNKQTLGTLSIQSNQPNALDRKSVV